MKFGKRLGILESNSHVCEYTPPIIIHTIVKPSESGPKEIGVFANVLVEGCLLYTSPSPRDRQKSRMPSSA